MKRLFLALCVAVILLPQFFFSQEKYVSDSAKTVAQTRINLINAMIKEKGYQWIAGITSLSYSTKEEALGSCGFHIDTLQQKEMLRREDRLYQEYNALNKQKLSKTLTVPNWISMMDSVWHQECANCWAYAAAGVATGLLHSYYGSNMGIHLNQLNITHLAPCGDCYGTNYLDCGLSYIYTYKVRSKPGLNQFPNFDHAYYTISSYNDNSVSIPAIKSSLQSSPVLAGMVVYEDFYYYYSGGVYRHIFGDSLGGHAVVIVGYNDSLGCWVCKNSWGGKLGRTRAGTD